MTVMALLDPEGLDSHAFDRGHWRTLLLSWWILPLRSGLMSQSLHIVPSTAVGRSRLCS